VTLLRHTFGADPEAFIYNKNIIDKRLGKIPYIIPPIALVKDFGAKYTRIKGKNVLVRGKDFQWSEDGAAIELQMRPTNDLNSFVTRITDSYMYLNFFLRKFGLHAVTGVPIGYFDTERFWKNRDDSFRSCVIFGCDPDQFPMLYLELGLDKINTKELDVSKHAYRYGGGHIHIQAPKENPTIYFENWHIAAIVFDFIAGLQNIIFKKPERIHKMEQFRLKYYGRPGRIRLQTYNARYNIHGIEYRVLPNTWTGNINQMTRLLRSLDVAATLIETNKGMKFVTEFQNDIPIMYRAIINSNIPTAKRLLNKVALWLHRNRNE